MGYYEDSTSNWKLFCVFVHHYRLCKMDSIHAHSLRSWQTAGGTGKVTDFLRVYGIILGIFFVTALPNFAHLFLKLPIIQFSVSQSYSPTIGIGQVLTSCWLAYISYKAVRIIHNLPRVDSILIGLSVPLINIGTLIFGAKVFFNLPQIAPLAERKLHTLATYVFIAATLVAIPLLLWVVYRIARKGRAENGGSGANMM